MQAGPVPIPTVALTTPRTTTPPTNGTGAIVCIGVGVTGKRVEVLYVVAADAYSWTISGVGGVTYSLSMTYACG